LGKIGEFFKAHTRKDGPFSNPPRPHFLKKKMGFLLFLEKGRRKE
jgi:hypothetical protein